MLFDLVEKRRFPRNGYRTNVDRRPENQVFDKGGRGWLRKGPYSNTVDERDPIVEEVRKMGIPCNRVCINRRRSDSVSPPMAPHRDARNTGERSYIMHWGSPVGEGALVTEHGGRYEEQRVWHDCGDLTKITHWVEPHFSGTRYSLVAFFGNPPRVKRRPSTAPEMCVDTGHDKT